MANLVLIEESLRPLFSGENPFEIVQELEGNIHRKYANRTTKEFILIMKVILLNTIKGLVGKRSLKILFSLRNQFWVLNKNGMLLTS